MLACMSLVLVLEPELMLVLVLSCCIRRNFWCDIFDNSITHITPHRFVLISCAQLATTTHFIDVCVVCVGVRRNFFVKNF